MQSGWSEFPVMRQPQAMVQWGIDSFHPAIALACSFSLEDVVLAHMAVQVRSDARIFAIDTGRLDELTYRCAEDLRRALGIRIEWFFPARGSVEKMEREDGLFSFRTSRPARHECCRIRKVEPLSRALAGLEAWITGMRQEQSVTRSRLESMARDDLHGGIVKLNPLADWKLDMVWDYVHRHNLPYNRLYDRGYQSIGCAPCTRAVRPGEDLRAGRWWWEQPEHKECGLHVVHGPAGAKSGGAE